MGYYLAGFLIVGIDNRPQPNYPYPFIQMDALEAMDWLDVGEGLLASDGRTYYLSDFDVIHASPPCQAHSKMGRKERHRDLLTPTLQRLRGSSVPVWVVENVPPNAPMNPTVTLCGSMFDLRLDGYGYLERHRWFESNIPLIAPAECRHVGRAVGVYGGGAEQSIRHNRPNVAGKRAIMQMPWATGREINEAIPPVYTECIGYQLLDYLRTYRQHG